MDKPNKKKLDDLFFSVLKGTRKVGRDNAALFLEALCGQDNPVLCISKLTTSRDSTGLDALQHAMCVDSSLSFFNGIAANVLKYLRDPKLEDVGNGLHLEKVIAKIVEGDLFWTPFLQAFKAGQLQENAQHGFAWLLWRLLFLAEVVSQPYRHVCQDGIVMGRLLASKSLDCRLLAAKIQKMLRSHFVGSPTYSSSSSPGGRHDNDHEDFRNIAILPTPDELASKELPFLRQSNWFSDDALAGCREAVYLCNYFRLGRQDMLSVLKEELQVVLGQTKGRHHGVVVDKLKFEGVTRCGRDGSQWGLVLECSNDLWFFKNVKSQERRKFLADNQPKFIKHQSLAALLINNQLVAFVTVLREDDLLAEEPPQMVVQLESSSNMPTALLKIRKASKYIKLVSFNAAIFAFEPILRALQTARGLPLSSELLDWRTGDEITRISETNCEELIKQLELDPSQDLQRVMRTKKQIHLDPSQSKSLIAGLRQSVSLIQGPPGQRIHVVTSNSYACSFLYYFRYRQIIYWCPPSKSYPRSHL